MNVLVTAAHPDDELLGVGGTIAKRVSRGDKVFVCILADGATARHTKVSLQKECAKKAVKEVGVSGITFLQFKDQRLDTYPLLEITKKLEKVFKTIKPEVVYTHHRGDLNMDHRIVCEATLIASRPVRSLVKELYCFETVSSTEWNIPHENPFVPNVYEDIDEFYDKKIKGLSHYKKTYSNEIEEFPHPRSLEALEALAKKRGSESGLKKAEAFMLIRKIHG